MQIKLLFLGTISGILLSSIMSTAIACGCTDKNTTSLKAKVESATPTPSPTKTP